jgi:hypothetical protein
MVQEIVSFRRISLNVSGIGDDRFPLIWIDSSEKSVKILPNFVRPVNYSTLIHATEFINT